MSELQHEEQEQKVGNYRLISLLGRGEFADLYQAEQGEKKDPLIVKLLHTKVVPEERQAFLQVARSIVDLRHPKILDVLDFGLEESVPYFVTGYQEQRTLRQMHSAGIQWPEFYVVSYLKQVAAALEYAHNLAVLHGDVRPENMLAQGQDEVLLTDFGITTITYGASYQRSQRVASTAAYTAPERFEGKNVPNSDQYALGIVAYEWLCGNVPFKGTFNEVREKHLSTPPVPLRRLVPGLSTYIEEVIMHALNKDPEKRFANVAAFANALEQASPLHTILRSTPIQPHPLRTMMSETLITPDPSDPTYLNPDETHRSVAPLKVIEQIQSANVSGGQKTKPEQSGPKEPTGKKEEPKKQRVSRRALIAGGLAGGSVVLTGAAVAFVLIQGNDQTTGVTTLPTNKQTRNLGTGVVGSTLATYRGHTGQVFVVDWSPDGKRIVSAANDTSVQVWDALTGNNVLSYQGHGQTVYAAAWSPDGRWIVSGGVDLTAQVWDAATGETLMIYKGHAKQVNTLAWSPDSKYVISSSNDTTVQIWEAQTGKLLFKYSHAKPPRSVLWSADGQLLASGGDDMTVLVYNVATQKQLVSFKENQARLWTMSWSPDGNYIATGGDEKVVRIFDVKTGKSVGQPFTGGSHPVNTVSWGKKHLISNSLERILIWDMNTNRIKPYLGHTDQVSSAKWSPDGKLVASCSKDQTVLVWVGA